MVVKNSAALVFAWVRWHGQSRAPARRQLAAAVCARRPLRVLAAAHCMARSRLALRMLAARSARCRNKVASLYRPEAFRAPALPSHRPRHRHAHARRAAPCTRARACRARSSRTLRAYAPRQRLMCSHIATRACTSKARMARSRHWPFADCRPARCMRIWLAHALQRARHLRCSCGACVAHTLCMPCTTAVVTCAER